MRNYFDSYLSRWLSYLHWGRSYYIRTRISPDCLAVPQAASAVNVCIKIGAWFISLCDAKQIQTEYNGGPHALEIYPHPPRSLSHQIQKLAGSPVRSPTAHPSPGLGFSDLRSLILSAWHVGPLAGWSNPVPLWWTTKPTSPPPSQFSGFFVWFCRFSVGHSWWNFCGCMCRTFVEFIRTFTSFHRTCHVYNFLDRSW